MRSETIEATSSNGKVQAYVTMRREVAAVWVAPESRSDEAEDGLVEAVNVALDKVSGGSVDELMASRHQQIARFDSVLASMQGDVDAARRGLATR